MRVTKLIREYVTEEVNKIYNPRINAVGADYMAEKDKLEEDIQKIIDEANEKVLQMMSELGYECSHYYNQEKVVVLRGSITNPEKYNQTNIEKTELKKARDNKIKDILINLELGATRAELDEMLKNI